MRQIVLAAHNYESAAKRFPGYAGEYAPLAVDVGSSPVRLDKHGVPWMVQVMPFMEQQQLSNNLGRICDTVTGANPVQASDYQFIEAVVPQFYCPSRRDAKSYPLVTPFTDKFGPYGARTDYAMNGGSALSVDPNNAGVSMEKAGVWQVGFRTAMKEITDGTSNSFFLGEKNMNPLRYKTGTDYGDRTPVAGFPEYFGASNSYVRYIARGPESDRPNSCRACHDFGSAHPTGWNSVMTDGSVKIVNYNADINILKALASIAGAETASLDD